MTEKRNQLNNNSGRGAGQQAGTNLGDQRAVGTHKQSAVIFDMISEGPIEGLVEGDARSIYLNGVPAVNPDSANAKKYLQTRSNDTTFTASSLTLVDNESAGNLFEYFQSGETERYLSIESAGKIFTSSISTVAGSNMITIKGSSSDTFVTADIRDFDSSNSTNTLPITRYIRIPGAGVNGGELIASIIRVHNTKKAQIQEIASTSVTDVTATMDAVLKATYSSSSQATVTNTGNTYTLRDVANVRSILSGSTAPRTTEDTPFNFKTFEWGFTTGERTQAYRETPVGIGSAAITYDGSKEALNQVTPGTGGSGSGYPVNGSGGFSFSNTGSSNTGTMTEGSANAFNKSHTNLNVTNAEEIDQIRINIGFDSLYAMDTESGEQKGSRAEFRVTFSYSRDGGTSFTDVVVFGPKGDLGGIIDDVGASGTGGSTSGRKFDRSGFLDEGDKSGYVRRNSSTPFVYILSFDTEKFQPFDSYSIKIERLDAVNFFKDGNQHQNASFLQSIEQIVEDKLNYPYTAYSQLLIGAEDFQSIPTRSYELRGMKVKVPTNYFPKDELDTEGVRRTVASYQRNVSSGADAGSDQDWDGNFRGDHKTFTDPDHVNYNTVYTNNPVWILLDLLTNKRYGLGSYIDPEFDLTQIDKYKLFQIAKYCDELVPDGKGGTEPRFTCNAYISQQQEALKLINDLMSVFRGILIWQNGQVSLNSNRQAGAIYTFGKSNVLGGQFKYQSSSTRKRINQVRVTWNDPNNSYKQEVEIVDDYDNIAETQRIINKDIRAFGCTSQGQAHRLGKWNLFTETLDSEVISFKTSINAGFLNPGDIIKVQDADRHNVQFSGRIKTGTSTTQVVLDRSVTLSGSGNSFLHLIYPSSGALLAQPKATINSVDYVAGDLVLTDESGAAIDTEVKASTVYDDSGNAVLLQWSENSRVETKQISGGSGSANITVSSAFSSAPNSEVIWAITTELADGSETDGSSEEYMVIAIDEQEDKSFDISAAPYNSEKYDLVDRGYVIPDIPAIMLPPKKADQVPAPQNISLMPKRVGGKGFKQSNEPSSVGDYDLLVSWSHPIVGNAMYEFVNQYEIKHNVGDQNSSTGQTDVTETILVDGKTNSFTIKGLTSGRSRVSIRLVNSAGYVSDFVHRTINFDPSKERTTQNSVGTKNSTPIAYGGSISKGQRIDSTTGIVTIGRADGYTFLPPAFDQRKTYGTSADENIETFNALSDGQTGFLLIDHSDTSDPLKAIIKVEDTTAESPRGIKENYQFFARLGQSNNDITSATGTVTIADGDTEVTGSSTTFTSDYSPGDNIIIGAAGTTRFIAKITNIESNTKLFIARGVTRAYSGTSIFKHGLIIDSIKDAVISKVSRSSSTYSIERFTTEEIIGDEPIAGLLNNTTGDEGTALFNKHTLKAQTFDSFKADGAISTTNFPDLRLFSQRKAGVTIPGSANNGQNDEMGRVSFTTNLIEFTNDNSGANLTNEIEVGEMKMTMTDRRNGFGLNGSAPGATMTFGLIQTGSQVNQTTIVDALSLNIHTGSTLKSLLDIDPRTGTTALKIDGTEIIDTSKNLTNIGNLEATGRINIDTADSTLPNTYFSAERYNDSNGKLIFGVAELSPSGSTTGETFIGNHNRRLHLGSIFDGTQTATASIMHMMIDEDGDLYVSQNNVHTQWFQASTRNLHNIGTISSGHITTTGQGLSPQLSIVDSDSNSGRCNIRHNAGVTDIRAQGTSGVGSVIIGGTTQGGAPDYCTFTNTGISVSGSVTATGDVIAFSSSDKRLKKNIVKIDSALNKVSQISGYHFEWKDKKEAPHQGKDIGVIAQEIEKVLPEIVSERETGYKAVNYQKLTALLIEAVKELKGEIDELKKNK